MVVAVAHYSFDDGTAADDGDNSLDGTINGATATTGGGVATVSPSSSRRRTRR